MWFHVKDYPGSHVLIKSRGEEIPEKVIFEAALFAANNSKNSGDKVDVDYTRVKFVKKPPGAKPGMVIYSNFNTIIVDKNKVGDE
jgi:predicted ribosome quality control (RQC) complex YloA/Tae2 family protein